MFGGVIVGKMKREKSDEINGRNGGKSRKIHMEKPT